MIKTVAALLFAFLAFSAVLWLLWSAAYLYLPMLQRLGRVPEAPEWQTLVGASWSGLWRALLVALVAALLSGAVAVGAVFAFSTTTRRALFFVSIAPLFANYALRTYIMSYIFRSNAEAAALLYHSSAAFLHLCFSALPYTLLFSFIGIEAVGHGELRAALNLGASRLQVSRVLIIPRLMPALAGGMAFAFAFSFGDRIAASVLGGKCYYVLPFYVRDLWMNSNIPGAALVALLQIAIVWFVLWPLMSAMMTAARKATQLGAVFGNKYTKRPRRRAGAIASIVGELRHGWKVPNFVLGAPLLGLIVILWIPAVALVISAMHPGSDLPNFSITGLDARAPIQALATKRIADASAASLFIAVSTGGLACVLGGILAHWAYALYGPRGQRAMGLVLFVPLLLPPDCQGLAYSGMTKWISTDHKLWAVIISNICLFTAVTYVFSLSRRQQLRPAVIDAAKNLGAGKLLLFRRIYWAHGAGAFVGAALVVAALSADEGVVATYVGGFTKTMSILVSQMLDSNFDSCVHSAASVSLVVTSTLILVGCLLYWFSMRKGGARDV
jgi:spermidine/putrescine transport system permease protein